MTNSPAPREVMIGVACKVLPELAAIAFMDDFLSSFSAAGLEIGPGWRDIEEIPEEWKDGREVLAICFEDYPQSVSSDGEYWKSLVTGRYVIPTHYKPIHPPAKET